MTSLLVITCQVYMFFVLLVGLLMLTHLPALLATMLFVDAVRDTESKARINGVAAQMEKFDFLFGAVIGELILRHSDNLSQTLKKKTTSAAEGLQVARMVTATLQSLRKQECYDLFWAKVVKEADSIGVEEPLLPRRHKLPARYDDSLASGHSHDTQKRTTSSCIMRLLTILSAV